MEALAVKYRPKAFKDVVGQDEIKTILGNQLETGEIKNTYLFCGGAGTGKTTTARIFANEINRYQGSPIELDAASNNSVDDVRELIGQAYTRALDCEFRTYIIDECHMITQQGWNAFLKTLEEPPAKSIFIFCTTNPERIPKTILSRVQRYDFQRLSQQQIINRLKYIVDSENKEVQENCGDQDSINDIEWAIKQGLPIIECDDSAIEYIAKISSGGMRDAITMLDKCIGYSRNITLENVVKALGVVDYELMNTLSTAILCKKSDTVIKIINDIHSSGKDLKVFIKNYTNFVLDLCKYGVTKSYEFLQIPSILKLEDYYSDKDLYYFNDLLRQLIKLNDLIKWDTNPKATIEATLLLECFRED